MCHEKEQVNPMHNILLAILVGLIVIAALLSIGQMWFILLSWDVFIKLIVTLGILTLLLGFLLIIKADFGEHKKLKDDNYID